MSSGANRGAKVLALVSDAWGGTGGIAQYARDFLEDVASRDDVREVVVVPRVIAREIQPLPPKVTHIESAARSKARFIASAIASGLARPDLVVCGHANLLPVAWLASRIARCPLLLLAYGIEAWYPRGAFWKRVINRCSAVVSISEFTLDKLRSWAGLDGVETFLVPNAIDLSRYTPGLPDDALRERYGIPAGHPLLLTLGRMEASEQAKGFDEVLDVLPSLLSRYPDLVYCAAGDGNDRARLEAKTKSLELGGHVVFPGYVAEDDKTELYRLCDLYVMPSRLEGFGYVFLEALACGKPVIASKVDGSREAVRGGSLGTVVDPSSRTELEAAVIDAVEKPFVPPRDALDFFSRDAFRTRGSAAVDAAFRARK